MPLDGWYVWVGILGILMGGLLEGDLFGGDLVRLRLRVG